MQRHGNYSKLNTQAAEGMNTWQAPYGIPATGTNM